MEPIKPLSVKFDPAVRKNIRHVSGLLNWPEGQFVNDCVGIVLELIADRTISPIHKTILLSQQAIDCEKAKFLLPVATDLSSDRLPRKASP